MASIDVEPYSSIIPKKESIDLNSLAAIQLTAVQISWLLAAIESTPLDDWAGAGTEDRFLESMEFRIQVVLNVPTNVLTITTWQDEDDEE